MDPNTGQTNPYTSPLGRDEIRLFRVFKYPDGSISGELRNFQLTKCPRFIATSYVWGSRDARAPIHLNGHTIDVLKTAHLFFEEMLSPDKYDQFPPSATWWWMDCICINQDDPAERSVQVGLMSAIYKRARKTVIWLGEESGDSDEGMGFLKLLAEDYTVYRTDEAYWRTNIRPHIASNSRGWKAVENLLTRKWWERVWTLQEFLLSKNAGFYCGSKRISLEHMAYAIHAIWDWHQRRDKGIISRRGYEKAWNRIRLLDWYSYTPQRSEHLPLVGVMTYTATSSVTDPRDRLYSLLGLISPTELAIIGLPDYESNPSLIYINFAVSFIRAYRTLDLLCIAPELKENLQSGQDENGLDLPSWVPDWSLRRRQSPPMLCMASQSANPHIGNFRPLHSLTYYREYRASGSGDSAQVPAGLSFSEDLRELTCKAIILDEIDGLGGGKSAAADDVDEDEPGAEAAYDMAEMVQSTSAINIDPPPAPDPQDRQDISTTIDTSVLITEQLARSLTLDRADPYLAKAASTKGFARELRRICQLEQQRAKEDGAMTTPSSFAIPTGLEETDRSPETTAEIAEWFRLNRYLHIRGLTLGKALLAGVGRPAVAPDVDEDPSQARKLVRRFRSTTLRRGKRLMVTRTGILGMAPRLARKGDVVCVVLGCSIPLVLRGDSEGGGDRQPPERFTVVGEAYVDGYMNGEAVEEVEEGLRGVGDVRIV